MIGSFNINDSSVKKDIFYSVGLNKFQTWQKPNNCTFVQFFILGGGGGGGAGQNAGTGTSRRGGGGGGSSSIVTTLFLATTLPDTLYISVGAGGAASTVNNNGGSGVLSYVTLVPDSAYTASNVVMQSGSAVAAGGLAGTAGGTGGNGGTVWSATGSILIEFGMFNYWVGQTGAQGNNTAASVPLLLSGITTGGAAGAGQNGSTAQNGGNIVGFGNIPTMSGGSAGSSSLATTEGGIGSGEYKGYTPTNINYSTNQLVFMGGAGGGSSNNGSGGAGGNAAFGCGGGGGGAGVTGSVNGLGGRGGDGIVIITSW